MFASLACPNTQPRPTSYILGASMSRWNTNEGSTLQTVAKRRIFFCLGKIWKSWCKLSKFQPNCPDSGWMENIWLVVPPIMTVRARKVKQLLSYKLSFSPATVWKNLGTTWNGTTLTSNIRIPSSCLTKLVIFASNLGEACTVLFDSSLRVCLDVVVSCRYLFSNDCCGWILPQIIAR